MTTLTDIPHVELSRFEKLLFDKYIKDVSFEEKGAKTVIAFLTCHNGVEIVGKAHAASVNHYVKELGEHYALVDALKELAPLANFASAQERFLNTEDAGQ